MLRKMMLAIVAVAGLCTASAQDEIEGTVGMDVVSRYIWRGQALGDAAVQPTATLSYKGLSLTAWSSFGFINKKDAKEFDLTLGYANKGFSIGVGDYYFSYYGAENNYFEYRAHDTQHVWEAYVGYDFGPVAAKWFTNIGGDDGVNKSGERAYSSYLELTAPFKFVTCDWTATAGIVPYYTSFYSDVNGFAVVNLALRATKEIPVYKKFSVPVFVEGSCNPSTKKGYLVLGFTIEP